MQPIDVVPLPPSELWPRVFALVCGAHFSYRLHRAIPTHGSPSTHLTLSPTGVLETIGIPFTEEIENSIIITVGGVVLVWLYERIVRDRNAEVGGYRDQR